jgi:uncharacterized cupin superfamily protein
MDVGNVIEFGSGNLNLTPGLINADWILEGKPLTNNKLLSKSADGCASTWMWDCTAGRFNWFYDTDETVYVVEGSVIIKDGSRTRHVSAGETIFFPAGSSAEWTVPHYVRKVAFLRSPLPRPVQFARRVYHGLNRLLGRKGNRVEGGNSLMSQTR